MLLLIWGTAPGLRSDDDRAADPSDWIETSLMVRLGPSARSLKNLEARRRAQAASLHPSLSHLSLSTGGQVSIFSAAEGVPPTELKRCWQVEPGDHAAVLAGIEGDACDEAPQELLRLDDRALGQDPAEFTDLSQRGVNRDLDMTRRSWFERGGSLCSCQFWISCVCARVGEASGGSPRLPSW